MNKKLHYLLMFTMILAGFAFAGCGSSDDEPAANEVTSAKVKFDFEVNDNFSKYFVIIAKYENEEGRTVTEVLQDNKINLQLSFKKFPCTSNIMISYARNSTPSPDIESTSGERRFEYKVQQTVTYIIGGKAEYAAHTDSYDNTPQAESFDKWANQLSSRIYSVNITKQGAVSFN